MSSKFWKNIFQLRILYPAHISTKCENGVSIQMCGVWRIPLPMWSSSRSHWRVSSTTRRPWSKKEDTTQRKQTQQRKKWTNPRKIVKGSFVTAWCQSVWGSSGQCDLRDRQLKITMNFFLMEGLDAWLSLAQIFIWALLVLTVGW